MVDKVALHYLFAGIVSSITLSGCVTVTDISSLEKGMSKAEAEEILGSPKSVISKSSGECRHYKIIAGTSYTPTIVVLYDSGAKIQNFGDYAQRQEICPE